MSEYIITSGQLATLLAKCGVNLVNADGTPICDPREVAEVVDEPITLKEIVRCKGTDNCVAERLREIAADMRNIGASSMTPHELFAYWAREVDKAADLADYTIESLRGRLKDSYCQVSERGKRENEGERKSCGGELTAEQVHDAIFNGSSYASYDGVKYYANGINMQAIADELNATLGGGRMNATEWLKLNRCPWCKFRKRKQCTCKVAKSYNGWRCYGYRCDEER